ncbi:MAG: tetratricopeptide repeat protein [Planctomycetota bacterium]
MLQRPYLSPLATALLLTLISCSSQRCAAQAIAYIEDTGVQPAAYRDHSVGVAYGLEQPRLSRAPYAVQQATPASRLAQAAVAPSSSSLQRSASSGASSKGTSSKGRPPKSKSVFSSLGMSGFWNGGNNAATNTSAASTPSTRRGAPRGARGRQNRAPVPGAVATRSQTPVMSPAPKPNAQTAATKPSSGFSKWANGLFGGSEDKAKAPAASPGRIATAPRAGAPSNVAAQRSTTPTPNAQPRRYGQRARNSGIAATPRQQPQGGLLSKWGWGGNKDQSQPLPTQRVIAAAPSTAPKTPPRRITVATPPSMPAVPAERSGLLESMTLPTAGAIAQSTDQTPVSPTTPVETPNVAGMIVVSDDPAPPVTPQATTAVQPGPQMVENLHAATAQPKPQPEQAGPAVTLPNAQAKPVTSAAKPAPPVIAVATTPKTAAPQPTLPLEASVATIEPQPAVEPTPTVQPLTPVAPQPTALAEAPAEPEVTTPSTKALADATPVAEAKPSMEVAEAIPAKTPAVAVATPVVTTPVVAAPAEELAMELPLPSEPEPAVERVTLPATKDYVAGPIGTPEKAKRAADAFAVVEPPQTEATWVIVGDEPRLAPRRAIAEPESYVDADTLEPTARARDLLTDAQRLATEAQTDDEYLAVVQRCRYALAIDKSPQAAGYAGELAAWALTKRGELLADAGRDAEAEVDFREALRCRSDCWRAVHNLGILAAQAGENEIARERFVETLELNPEFAKAYSNLAALAVVEGEYAEAIVQYQHAIEIDPDLGVAHAGCGRVCHMVGELDLALRHLDAAELLAPEDNAIASSRGDLLVDLGRYGLAKQAYERAITISPADPTAHRNLAWLLATCPVEHFRDGRAALEYVAEAERLLPSPDDILLDTTAAALASVGRFNEAQQVARQAIELAPEPDASEYRERLALYEQGEAFTTQPLDRIRQAAHDEVVRR